MKSVPLGSQNPVEFTASLLFLQHNRLSTLQNFTVWKESLFS